VVGAESSFEKGNDLIFHLYRFLGPGSVQSEAGSRMGEGEAKVSQGSVG